MNYFYCLFFTNEAYFKIGISNNLESICKNNKRFGEIDILKSLIYISDNKILIENIKNGLNAYLNNYHHTIKELNSGSTEIYNIEGLEKAKLMINLFENELENFSYKSNLKTSLNSINYDENIRFLNNSSNFMDKHRKVIDDIHLLILKNINVIEVEKNNGFYILKNIDLQKVHFDLPEYKWVIIEEDVLKFDIQEFNRWKKNGEQIVIRKLIEIKYFNKYTWDNFKVLFK